MVLGSDIGLEGTCSLALCALVGRISYRTLCKTSVPAWVATTWTPLLGYSPEVIFLSKGWFRFLFNSLEDTPWVLEKPWVIDGINLMIKCWRVSFDTDIEYFSVLTSLGIVT
jgi:hypothetical protein